MSDLTDKTSKASFFLEGHRRKTLKPVLLKDATPSKLLRLFKQFGLEENPDVLEDVENNTTLFGPDDCKTVFEDLEPNGIYQIPFSGNLKGDDPKDTTDSGSTSLPTRPPAISDDDIHRALVCCEIVYGSKENKIRERFDEQRSRHDFDTFCVSSSGPVKYMIAVREEKTKSKDESSGSRKQSEVFIVFRGTNTFEDILADLQIFRESSDFEGKFHSGFHKLAATIPVTSILQKYEGCKIVVCGHSMGGAVAQIVALKMLVRLKLSQKIERDVHLSPPEQACSEECKASSTRVSCVTFGSPLVADKGVSQYIEKYGMTNDFLNVINQNDPVPCVLRLAQTLQMVSSKVAKISASVRDVLCPILKIFSMLHLGAFSMVADFAREIIDKIAEGIDKANKFLQENMDKFSALDEIYAPVGWYLFYSFETIEDKFSQKATDQWKTDFLCNYVTISERLAKINELSEQGICQHKIINYAITVTSDGSIKKTDFEAGKSKSTIQQMMHKKKSVKEKIEFPLKVKSIKLYRTCEVGPGIDRLQVTIHGENLSFFCLNESVFKGIPSPSPCIVSECCKDRLECSFETSASAVFESTLVFTIAGHFDKCEKTVHNTEIQKIKAKTVAEILYDDLNPVMLQKAFQRGVAMVTMQSTTEKKAHEKEENPFLKILYQLEMFANPKLKSVSDTKLLQLVEKAVSSSGVDNHLYIDQKDSEESLKVMTQIAAKMGSHIQVDVERSWHHYVVASVLGLAGVAAVVATGGGAAAFIIGAGAVAQIGAAVGAVGAVSAAGTGLLNYFYHRRKSYEDNYRVVLRTFIEELPDIPDKKTNKMLKNAADLHDIIKLEETVFKLCSDAGLKWMYPGSNIWRSADEILGTLPFEDSRKFKAATRKSLEKVIRHIKMCTELYMLRLYLMGSCFLGVVGLQDSGKSTMIGKTWKENVKNIGFNKHTKQATLYRITGKMTVVDFPGTTDIEQGIAETLNRCGVVASFFVYIMQFNGDPSKIHVDEMKGIVPFDCPVLVCINQCSRYLDAFPTRNSVHEFEEKYRKVIQDTFEQALEDFEDLKPPEFELMFTDFRDFDADMEAKGLKSVRHVQEKLKEWLVEYGVYNAGDVDLYRAVGQDIPTEMAEEVTEQTLSTPVQEMGDAASEDLKETNQTLD